jgi:hypothetical protein
MRISRYSDEHAHNCRILEHKIRAVRAELILQNQKAFTAWATRIVRSQTDNDELYPWATLLQKSSLIEVGACEEKNLNTLVGGRPLSNIIMTAHSKWGDEYTFGISPNFYKNNTAADRFQAYKPPPTARKERATPASPQRSIPINRPSDIPGTPGGSAEAAHTSFIATGQQVLLDDLTPQLLDKFNQQCMRQSSAEAPNSYRRAAI